MGFLGFSFSRNRALGITKLKNQISRSTGIPTTRSGRQRKVGSLIGNAGWLLLGSTKGKRIERVKRYEVEDDDVGLLRSRPGVRLIEVVEYEEQKLRRPILGVMLAIVLIALAFFLGLLAIVGYYSDYERRPFAYGFGAISVLLFVLARTIARPS